NGDLQADEDSPDEGQGKLALRRERGPVSGLHRRHRDQRFGPRPPGAGGGHPEAGGGADSLLEPVRDPLAGRGRGDAHRSDRIRQGLLLQLRHRGGGGRDQASPQARLQRARPGEERDPHLHQVLPRPHLRQPLRHSSGYLSAGLRSDGPRLRLHTLRRTRSRQRVSRSADSGDSGRADPRRRWHQRGARGLSAGPARPVRRARGTPHLRRGPDRRGPYRTPIRLPGRRRSPGRPHERQGIGRRLPGRCDDGQRGVCHARARQPRLDLWGEPARDGRGQGRPWGGGRSHVSRGGPVQGHDPRERVEARRGARPGRRGTRGGALARPRPERPRARKGRLREVPRRGRARQPYRRDHHKARPAPHRDKDRDPLLSGHLAGRRRRVGGRPFRHDGRGPGGSGV
ncbi:MAG: Acetylornithine aminotransferase, partial [uncultured Rubrobacteraceae bacterium]